MKFKRDWLWDRKISTVKAKAILNNPQDKHFLVLASTLLSRKNTPREVFIDYLKPVIFFKSWNKIKKQMRKNSWNDPRIGFWQAIYEKLKEKYNKKGLFSSKEVKAARPEDEFCKLIADKIKSIRKQKKLTQWDLAKRLKVSQQMVSRIERGRENLSILTLKGIADALGSVLSLEIGERKEAGGSQ